jgi:cytochrome c-type biogenesis protein CcmE
MPYRDDVEALEQRRQALEADLAEVKRELRARRRPLLAAPRVASEPRLCVRCYELPDGPLLTRDCPIGANKRTLGRIKRAGFLALLAAGAAAEMWAVQPDPPIALVRVDEVVRAQVTGRVRAQGTLVHGSITRTDDGDTWFWLHANGVSMPVRYSNTVLPDTFLDCPGFELPVVVEGQLGDRGVFGANILLAKAPPKGGFASCTRDMMDPGRTLR